MPRARGSGFAATYADTDEADHTRLIQVIDDGGIEAVSGV